MAVGKKFGSVLCLVLAGVLVVGCSSGGGDSSDAGAAKVLSNGAQNAGSEADSPPAHGGTLHFNELIPTQTLDPIAQSMGGASGGVLTAAIFDTLVRYDRDTNTYVPQLADDVSANDDNSVWTIRLRDGVQFTDGTVFDAAAVAAHLQRYTTVGQGKQFAPLIQSVTTPDPVTVVVTLTEPWSGFPFLLATNGGMVPSPAAVAAEGEQFGTHPVGAGPFVLQSFRPGERIELVRNDDYWGGAPPLDGIVVTSVQGAGAAKDRLDAGDVDLAYVYGDKQLAGLRDAGYPGWIFVSGGFGIVLNERRSELQDDRIAEAMQSALNREQLNERASDGVGFYSAGLFQRGSVWESDGSESTQDVERARQLVGEVKEETGWDGNITFVSSGQDDQNLMLAVQAQLQNVGLQVDVEKVPDFNSLIQKVYIDHDFDAVITGLSIRDEAPWTALTSHFASTSQSSVGGYSSPQMDTMLAELARSDSEADRQNVLDNIGDLVIGDAGFVPIGGGTLGVFWSEGTGGVVPSAAEIVLLDKAYVVN